MEREEKSNEKRSEGLYFAPGTKERNKGRENRETEKEREYSNKWVWHRKCVWERERGGWVRTNFPWLVEPCYTVHPHPRWWKHMAPCERVWEKKVWRLTVSVWSHKRGAWQKCVCARVCTCDTNAATKVFLGEEENVTREQRYLIFAATLEEMSTSTNTQQKRNQKLLMDKTKRSHYTFRTNCSVIVSLFILSKSLFSPGPNQSVPNRQKTVDPHVHTDRRLKFPIEQLDWAQQNKWAIHKTHFCSCLFISSLE